MFTKDDEKFMKIALWNATKAFQENEVPVSAVLVNSKNEVVQSGYNTREKDNSIFSHAETKVIQQESQRIQNWNLSGYTLYTTLEPCSMCMGAILQSRISRVVFATSSEKYGSSEIKNDPHWKNIVVEKGLLEDDAKKLLTSFFEKIREQ